MLLIERWRQRQRAEDRRAGEVVAMIYNANRDAKKDPKGKTWLDIFPEWKEKPAEQTDEQIRNTMMMLVRATGGRKRKRQKRIIDP